jgi:hypothetical protein
MIERLAARRAHGVEAVAVEALGLELGDLAAQLGVELLEALAVVHVVDAAGCSDFSIGGCSE